MSREIKVEYTPSPEVRALVDRYFAAGSTKIHNARGALDKMRALQIDLLELHLPTMDEETAARARLTTRWLDQEMQAPGKTPPWRGLSAWSA